MSRVCRCWWLPSLLVQTRRHYEMLDSLMMIIIVAIAAAVGVGSLWFASWYIDKRMDAHDFREF